MRRSALLTVSAIAGLASLTACGSSTKTATPAAPASASAAASSAGTTAAAGSDKITIKNFMFMPMDDTIKVGTTVTWTNTDSAAHSVESNDKTFPTSKDLKMGDTYSYTFTKAGKFSYICGIHNYMMATITVS